jgi:hypothetical protein
MDESVWTEPRPTRRSFLGQLGKTVALGLGLSALAGGAARAAHASATACGITCTPVSGSCSSACCNNPPCPTKLFSCHNNCDGTNFFKCLSHSCTTYCFSQGC